MSFALFGAQGRVFALATEAAQRRALPFCAVKTQKARLDPMKRANGLDADHASACQRSFPCQTMACAFGGTLVRALRARAPLAPQAATASSVLQRAPARGHVIREHSVGNPATTAAGIVAASMARRCQKPSKNPLGTLTTPVGGVGRGRRLAEVKKGEGRRPSE